MTLIFYMTPTTKYPPPTSTSSKTTRSKMPPSTNLPNLMNTSKNSSQRLFQPKHSTWLWWMKSSENFLKWMRRSTRLRAARGSPHRLMQNRATSTGRESTKNANPYQPRSPYLLIKFRSPSPRSPDWAWKTPSQRKNRVNLRRDRLKQKRLRQARPLRSPLYLYSSLRETRNLKGMPLNEISVYETIRTR